MKIDTAESLSYPFEELDPILREGAPLKKSFVPDDSLPDIVKVGKTFSILNNWVLLECLSKKLQISLI